MIINYCFISIATVILGINGMMKKYLAIAFSFMINICYFIPIIKEFAIVHH